MTSAVITLVLPVSLVKGAVTRATSVIPPAATSGQEVVKNFDEMTHRGGGMGRTPQKCPFPLRDSGRHLIHVLSPHPKRHLDRFNCFSTAHGYGQQTALTKNAIIINGDGECGR